jgi:hypothetical protein
MEKTLHLIQSNSTLIYLNQKTSLEITFLSQNTWQRLLQFCRFPKGVNTNRVTL